jgi:hypothetical protein
MPTVRFDTTDEERNLLTSTHAGIPHNADFKSMDLEQAFDMLRDPNKETDQTIFATQAHMLLVMRIFIGSLRVGNTIEDTHTAVIAMLSGHPKDTSTLALDWAKPDMSALTGEPNDDPMPELDQTIKRMIKRVERVFKKTAAMMPATISWSRIGMDLGLNPEDVAVAAGSSLDFDYVMGDMTCFCDYCKEKRGA